MTCPDAPRAPRPSAVRSAASRQRRSSGRSAAAAAPMSISTAGSAGSMHPGEGRGRRGRRTEARAGKLSARAPSRVPAERAYAREEPGPRSPAACCATRSNMALRDSRAGSTQVGLARLARIKRRSRASPRSVSRSTRARALAALARDTRARAPGHAHRRVGAVAARLDSREPSLYNAPRSCIPVVRRARRPGSSVGRALH
jgi:hypothetical protein